MTKEELKHNLAVLVELRLYQMLQVLKEISIPKEMMEKEQQITIINFINELPQEYKNMENRDLIIAQSLKEMGVNTAWGKKKIQELEKKVSLNNKESNNIEEQER